MTSSAAAVPAPATPTPIAAEPDTWLALGELTADIVADLARAPTFRGRRIFKLARLGGHVAKAASPLQTVTRS